MPKRSGTYRIPFDVAPLSYGEALAHASDTGVIKGAGNALLETVVAMLDELERPDEYVDCIQIAGTNGKSSTSRYTAAILRGEGIRTGLYTSPHLVHFEERIEIAGTPVSQDVFVGGIAAAVEAGKRVNEKREQQGQTPYFISPFDVLTVGAFVMFAREAVEVAVLEVGLGGRWDATSACDPVAVAVTGIGFDHMHILGNTLEEIAEEKAAIIGPGKKVVLGEGVHEPGVWNIMQRRCETCGVKPLITRHNLVHSPASLDDTLRFEVPAANCTYSIEMYVPEYQAQNVACAVLLAESYMERELNNDKLNASLLQCPTPGRFDIVKRDPLIMVDACHNPQSCENFVHSLESIVPKIENRPTLLFATLSDKDAEHIVQELAPAFPKIVVTQTASSRALPASKLAAMIKPASKVAAVYENVFDAVEALIDSNTPFVAAGTITLAGEVLDILSK